MSNLLEIQLPQQSDSDKFTENLASKTWRCHILLLAEPKGVVKEEGIYVSYVNDDNWGVFFRFCAFRNLKQLMNRPATFDEAMEEGSNLYRLSLCAHYTDWDTLITDEKMFGVSPEWIAELERLKAKFPKFNLQQMQTELQLWQ